MSQPTIEKQQDKLIEERKEIQRQLIESWETDEDDDQTEIEELEHRYVESLKESFDLAMSETPYNSKIIVDTLYELVRFGKIWNNYTGYYPGASFSDSYDMEEVVCYLFDHMKDSAFDDKLKYPIAKWLTNFLF